MSVSAGTLSVDGNCALSAGEMSVESGATLAIRAACVQSGGVMTGDGNVIVTSGEFTFSGGTWGGFGVVNISSSLRMMGDVVVSRPVSRQLESWITWSAAHEARWVRLFRWVCPRPHGPKAMWNCAIPRGRTWIERCSTSKQAQRVFQEVVH